MTKHHLTLCPAWIGNGRLISDFIVRRDLRPVGRIHLANPSFDSDSVWEWGISLPLPTPWWCLGRVYSLEQAKVAFLDAWMRYYDELSTEQVALWHKQQDAVSTWLSKPTDTLNDGALTMQDIVTQLNLRPLSEAD